MASTAHAFFCFEVLSSSYHTRSHPSLEQVLDLYDQYQRYLTGEEEVEIVEQESEISTPQEQEDGIKSPPQLRSISRIQDLTSSTPSSTSSPSVNSSTSQLTGSSGTNVSVAPTYASRLSLTQSYPLFVTWNTLSRSGHKSLRGCIGTFDPLPLEKGLETYALTSAFEDTRFSPISVNILPNLSCSLTLLADFEDCSNPMDWEVGKHGIRISFTHRYRRHGATYLPDVAVEQGWTREETLESLMRKAGWESSSRRNSKQSIKPWEDFRDFKVVRYTGLKASGSYSAWQEWQSWAKSRTSDIWL